jgi:cysteine desulfurase family protein (TIGR01976 family)
LTQTRFSRNQGRKSSQEKTTPIDISKIRVQFPALNRDAIFFDNPGGTQVARPVIDRMTRYLVETNANHGGAFATSIASDEILDEARLAMADFYNAARPEEIVFGNNMTTLTLHISRSIARTWNQGDEIVVTRLDHDANITPWVLAAKDRGVKVHWVDFDPEEGTLDMGSMARALETHPRLVALGYASNALGTINPIKEIIHMAKAVGSMVCVDAVQYAAHGLVDVQDLDCDFLVSSSYKWFGPHAGILYGKYDVLKSFTPYKVRPATDEIPGRWETGTQNHEGIAGILGAMEYLEWVGKIFGNPTPSPEGGRRWYLEQAMKAIRKYEYSISHAVLDVLESLSGCRIYGLTERDRIPDRVPTFSFNMEGWHPRKVSERLASENIYVWDGNYYALAVTERLGLEGKGGMVRVGPVHYNTLEEVARLGEVLASMAKK